MEKFIWRDTKTYTKFNKMSEAEQKQWSTFIFEEEDDWSQYEECENGYRIDIWLWGNETLKNIVAFPGDTPVGALFLNDDSSPIITETDGDLNICDIVNINPLQQELQDNFKIWKHVQRTVEEKCEEDHEHCITQYHNMKNFYLKNREFGFN